MKRKVSQLQFVNGMGTVNLRNTPKMSLNAKKDAVDITMTEVGYFIKYTDSNQEQHERFMPLGLCFDVQLMPEDAEVKVQKSSVVK